MQINYLLDDRAIPGSYWQWQDRSIYYVKAGELKSGKPPLLLVHGFGASTDHWRKNIAELQQRFQVWAIDLLGFGRSAKPNIEYSGNLWREQLHDFITQVIGSPVILAGNSLGGYASLCVAAEYSEAVKGLILINSAGSFSDLESKPQPNSLQQSLNRVRRSILLHPWASYILFQYVRRRSTIRKTLEKVYLDRTAIDDCLIENIYRPSCDKGAVQVFAAVFKTPPGEKVDVLLQQMNCPLLLLWGEADPWMTTKARSEQFHRHYDLITEYYLKAGHCPHDEIPQQVNNLIADWILSVSDRDSSLLTS
jgi:pimeloyl-ACP methyl ester carboxylesterase